METDPRTEEFLRRILEAKEEKSSIRSKSSTLKTDHDMYARGLIHEFKDENIECVEVPPGPVYVRVAERKPRLSKVNAKQVSNFSKQWIESNATCIHELSKSFDFYLSNSSEAIEELDSVFNATNARKKKKLDS